MGNLGSVNFVSPSAERELAERELSERELAECCGGQLYRGSSQSYVECQHERAGR